VAIEEAVQSSVYIHLLHDPCRIAAHALIERLQVLADQVMARNWDTETLQPWEVAALQTMYTKFETLFLGDLQAGALYLV
jgi:hypothetical protein